MSQLVTYQLKDSVATITMDDGKVNVQSLAMTRELNGALDQASADKAVVLLAGKPGVFSAGFDLKVLGRGGEEANTMIFASFELAERLLAFPTPVVIACTGHALAMGVFLLLSGDLRIGAEGAFKIGATEVAIGITMPHFGVEMCRQRLAPAYFNRAVINAEIFSPGEAVQAGFLDRVTPPADLASAALDAALGLAKLDSAVHFATKLRTRAQTLKAIRTAIETDGVIFRTR